MAFGRKWNSMDMKCWYAVVKFSFFFKSSNMADALFWVNVILKQITIFYKDLSLSRN